MKLAPLDSFFDVPRVDDPDERYNQQTVQKEQSFLFYDAKVFLVDVLMGETLNKNTHKGGRKENP